jgi:hypothetical protein
MILFSDDTSWDAVRRSVRFTASALAATKDHTAMAKTPRALLKSWKQTDDARLEADDALVDANAKVAALDGELDDLVTKFASEILHEVRQDRTDALYVAFFPDAPSDIVRLGLASEIERTKKFFVVATQRKPGKAALSVLEQIKSVQADGEKALAERVEATAEVAKVSLRIQTWKEDANGARRSVETALDQYSNENKLSRGYADRYFPQVARATRRPKPKDGGGTTPPPSPPPETGSTS